MNEQNLIDIGFKQINKDSIRKIFFRNEEGTIGITLRPNFYDIGQSDLHVYQLDNKEVVKTYYEGWVKDKEELINILKRV